MTRLQMMQELVLRRRYYLRLVTSGQLSARKGLAVVAYLDGVLRQIEARMKEAARAQ